jgi:hypothetical protein
MGFLEEGFEVLTAVSTKIAVFWVVEPCSLVEVYPDYTVPQTGRKPSSVFLKFIDTTFTNIINWEIHNKMS